MLASSFSFCVHLITLFMEGREWSNPRIPLSYVALHGGGDSIFLESKSKTVESKFCS